METAEITEHLRAALRELDNERRRLESALRGLGGSIADRGRGTVRRAQGKRRTKSRAAKGQRRDEFLAVVKGDPGTRAADVAKKIGISSNQAYGLARQLLDQGLLSKSGNGYRAKDASGGGQGKGKAQKRASRKGKAKAVSKK